MATQTATKINRKTDLVNTQSITYIRAITLTVKITNCKPNTQLYPTFDGYPVDDFIEVAPSITSEPIYIMVPETGTLAKNTGLPIITDSNGAVTVFFYIPGFKFTTGKKKLIFSEDKNFIPGATELVGSTYGSVSGEFTSNGVKQFYQETVTTTNTITITTTTHETIEIQEPPWRPNIDPIAQSFNTFGVSGGCFVTGVDVYFSSKDIIVPITLELREMVNGYPGPRLLSSYGRVTLNPGQVNVSANASAATTFQLSNMVYLMEDAEYCFVLITNSTKYNLYTAVLGEISLETGKKVFAQPQTGSIFKSQNNSTWTADQFEDVKFNIKVAEFNINTAATLPMIGTAMVMAVPSEMLSTVSGSNVIHAKMSYRHGLEVDSKVKIAVNPLGIYNGISAADMVGEDFGNWSVTAVKSEYEFDFAIIAPATVTGNFVNGANVVAIHVINGGSGYTVEPSVVITGTGAGATATAIVRDGVVTSITITNAGTGYTVAPTVTIVGSPGSGATATALINSSFAVVTNRLAHTVNPVVPNFVPAGTDIRSTLKSTLANFTNSGLTSYSAGHDTPIDLNSRTELNQNVLVASKSNEFYKMSTNPSTTLELVLTSSNKNVSPVVDVSTASLLMSNNNINSQFDEVVDTTTSSYGTVDSIVISGGGSGYGVAPTVSFVNATNDVGTGATATAVITSGVVTAVNITNAGSGYTKPPVVVFTGSNTTLATAVSTLSDFNTELTPYSGRAFSRYLTKIINLETVSKGIRVFTSAYSSNNTDIDFYIRTSLSSESALHTEKGWVNLTCDVSRNLSRSKSEFIEYVFYNNNLAPFDAFDLKIVMKTKVPFDVPVIENYRAIVIV